MPRIDLLTQETAPAAIAELLAGPNADLAIFRALAHAEGNFKAVMRLGGSILRHQQLDPRKRELLILLAARIEQGEYEWTQHVAIARELGASDAQIEAVERLDLDADCFDPSDRALLAFGRAVVEDVRVPDRVFEATAAHHSAREIVESVLTVGFYMMLARLTESLQIPSDPPRGIKVIEAAAATRARPA